MGRHGRRYLEAPECLAILSPWGPRRRRPWGTRLGPHTMPKGVSGRTPERPSLLTSGAAPKRPPPPRSALLRVGPRERAEPLKAFLRPGGGAVGRAAEFCERKSRPPPPDTAARSNCGPRVAGAAHLDDGATPPNSKRHRKSTTGSTSLRKRSQGNATKAAMKCPRIIGQHECSQRPWPPDEDSEHALNSMSHCS